MTYPNLAGVITKDDVFRKGTGSYAADYISWARIANHLHTAAPGWEFHIKPAPDGGHVWQAPDGSAYLVTYFTGPEEQATPDFVYPCQDNRNQPIRFDKVSCRTLTDSHRRALCANAAFSFSLGYELWAREEVEEAKDPLTLLGIRNRRNELDYVIWLFEGNVQLSEGALDAEKSRIVKGRRRGVLRRRRK